MEIIGGYAFGYIERYEALVKHVIKKKIKGKKIFLYFLQVSCHYCTCRFTEMPHSG